MCGRVDTGVEVAVGRGLVAISERLIARRARLVGVRQPLVAIGEYVLSGPSGGCIFGHFKPPKG